MRIKNKNKINRSAAVRSRARELLFSGGNYMTMVFSLVISMPFLFLGYLLASAVADYTYDSVPFILMIALGFFIGGPMLLGVVNVAVAVYRKSKSPLAEMFFAFSSGATYLRALLLTLIQLLKLFIELMPALVIGSAADEAAFRAGLPNFLCGLLSGVLTVGVVILMKALLSRFYGTLFFAFDGDELRVRRAISSSFDVCKGKTLHTMRMRLGFLPLFVLSVILLGLPLLWYTVPYMLCAYVSGMAHISDGELTPVAEEAVTETEEAPPGTEEINENEEIIENGDINNE